VYEANKYNHSGYHKKSNEKVDGLNKRIPFPQGRGFFLFNIARDKITAKEGGIYFLFAIIWINIIILNGNNVGEIYMYRIIIIVLLLVSGCTGIQLADNCGSGKEIKLAVLPFTEDGYQANRKIEGILASKCYTIVSGEQLLHEYVVSVGRSLAEITMDEFLVYAKSRGVDKVVTGSVSVIWEEGHRAGNGLVEQAKVGDVRNGISDENVYQLLTGNYAVADCYIYDTGNGEKSEIFRHYKIRKI
jgi:hypothetical protein